MRMTEEQQKGIAIGCGLCILSLIIAGIVYFIILELTGIYPLAGGIAVPLFFVLIVYLCWYFRWRKKE